MRLQAVQLRNIRSYKSERIRFPEGLILLAGDIGCGKSTILLAIEFALFGIRRGELSGAALLRHGEQEGMVSLTLDIAGKEVVVQRVLKRNSNGIAQGPGALIIDGAKTELTAVELKARILELLAYPEQLLGQHKSLVFRYTVYTPQEQMKQILIEKPEERLDTFRKLFGIDKYRLIRENTVQLGREIKNKIARLEGQADDLEQLEQRKQEHDENAASLEKRLAAAKKAVDEHAQPLKAAQAKVAALEKDTFAYEQLKSTLAVASSRKEQFTEESTRLEKEMAELRERIKDAPPTAQELDQQEAGIKKKVALLEQQQQALSQQFDAYANKIGKFAAIVEREEEVMRKIASLDTCPTCKQIVRDDHKSSIKDVAEKKVETAKQQQERNKDEQEKITTQRATLTTQQQELQREYATISVLREKLNAHEERKRRLRIREERNAHLVKELAQLQKSIVEKQEKMTGITIDTNALTAAKQHLQQLQEKGGVLDVELARIQEQERALKKEAEQLVLRITQKKRALAEAKELGRKHTWLTKHFSNLMFTIEKHVLMNLYHLFNDAFKEWFDTLIEDEAISVRLAEDFSPLIEQNGYEAMVEQLSGGERTSVALAYRLALNNVVNKALHTLQTRDLLILDEPTDGFSGEQLDRVKEVLGRLGLSQVLIVSHEPKMESFVDHIIRVTKNEHESKVLTRTGQ